MHDGAIELLDARADVDAQTLTFSVDTLSPFMVMAQRLHKVTFDTAGGSSVEALSDVPSGTRLAFPATPSKPGFAFVGWYRDAAGSQPWDFAADAVTDDMTLHAVWKEAGAPGPEESTTPPPDGLRPDEPQQTLGGAVPGRWGGVDSSNAVAAFPLLSGTGDLGAGIALPLCLGASVVLMALFVRRMRRRMR